MRIRFCTLPFTMLFSVSCFLVAANVVMVSSSGQAQVEVSKPIGLNGLSQALKIGGLTPEKLVQIIRERGVSFKVDVDIEKQLRNAGADEKVIQAARENYRGETLKPGPVVDAVPDSGAQSTSSSEDEKERGQQTAQARQSQATLLLQRGNSYFAKQEFDAAIQDYSAVISLDSSSPAPFANRGHAYNGKGEYDRAIQDFDEAIRLNSGFANAYLGRGISNNQKGKTDEALSDFDRAIGLDPNLTNAFLFRGSVYNTQGQFERAVSDFDKVIRNSPNSSGVYYERGLSKFFMADLAGAAADFEQSLAPNRPAVNSAYVLLWLHIANRRLGKNDTTDFAQRAAREDQLKWPAPIIRLYNGELTEEQVVAAAADSDAEKQKGQLCEVHFYAAEYALFHGDLATGLRRLDTAKEVCPRAFTEFQGAVQEIQRMRFTDPGYAVTSRSAVSSSPVNLNHQEDTMLHPDNEVDAGRYWADPATGLMWTKEDNGQDISWQGASNYCRNLVLGNSFKWRLPTIDELETIYDRSPKTGGGNVIGDIRITRKLEWSNSSGYNPREKFVFGFDFGHRGSLLDINFNGIRSLCVRRSSDHDAAKQSTSSPGMLPVRMSSGEYRLSLNGNIHRVEISDDYVTISPVTGHLSAHIPIKIDGHGKRKIEGQWESDNLNGWRIQQRSATGWLECNCFQKT